MTRNSSDKKVRTGIIAAAGSAARMWPSSKVVPKELFPLGRLPAIAYVILEMQEAGIDRIAIVVRKDGFRAIEALLDPAIAPPQGVRDDEIVQRFEGILRSVTFTFIEQSGPYGNGTPLLNGVARCGNEACVYAFADDVVFGENVSAGLIETFRRTGHPVLAAQPVPEENASSFGILECTALNGIHYVKRFVEKPLPGETTSRLASIGRYLVTPEVIDLLKQTALGRDGELWLSDAFVGLLRRGLPLGTFELTSGQWYTVGNPEGFTKAVLAATRARPS